MELVDKNTTTITCRKPGGKPWRYSAGQYVFLQVPAVSLFQWHPFTISHCADDVLQLHIKADGDWTKKIRELESEIKIGIDGPFGAPAQRFYEYDRSLIIGAGVGITPFSAIISDLEQSIFEEDGWERHSRRWSLRPSSRSSSSSSSSSDRRSSRAHSQKRTPSTERGETSILANGANQPSSEAKLPCKQRVDFHWMVREKNDLLWFSDLLNRAHDMSRTLPPGKLDLNVHTHITLKRTNISEHIFRYLLDAYRTDTCPVSALTGLKMRSHFGRPDFEAILEAYHEDVRREIAQGHIEQGMRIAVFFCGAPAIGEVLSDLCHELTIRGRGDDSEIRWDFRMEVFG
jgi:respiratory burst oxidase